MEEWRDIEGFDGLYKVSNQGRIKAMQRTDSIGRHRCERILSPRMSGTFKGYTNRTRFVEIMINNKTTKLGVAREVAKAFIGEIKEGCCVVHLDKDPSNDRVDNLAIMTYSASLRIDFALGKKPLVCSPSGSKNRLSKPVEMIDESGKVVREFESLGDCQRNGFNKQTVSSNCRGEHPETWRPYGHRFRFKKI